MGSSTHSVLFFVFCIWSCYSCVCVKSLENSVYIDAKSVIGRIDDDFICATLDWWPPQKCDYGTCAWGRASLLNLVFFIFSYLLFCV